MLPESKRAIIPLISLLVFTIPCHAQREAWRLVNLGAEPIRIAEPYQINLYGQVIGDYQGQYVFWDGASTRYTVPTRPGAINDAGDLTRSSTDEPSSSARVLINGAEIPGQPTESYLWLLPASINNRKDVIIARFDTVLGTYFGSYLLTWQSVVATRLPGLATLNDSADIAGSVQQDIPGIGRVYRAFIQPFDSALRILPILRPSIIEQTGLRLNNRRDVIGVVRDAISSEAVLWPAAGGVQALWPGSPSSFNNRGQIVGYSGEDVVYRNGTTPHQLNGVLGAGIAEDVELVTVRDINTIGIAIGTMRIAGETLATGYSVTPFRKWKQFGTTHGINIGAKPIDTSAPPSPINTFKKNGCVLSSCATILGLYGFQVSPLDVRDDQRGGALNGLNMALSRFRYEKWGLEVSVKQRSFGWNLLVSNLLRGQPVILRVPTVNTKKTVAMIQRGAAHYIVAYAVRPTLTTSAEISVGDIFISDPGSQYPYRDIMEPWNMEESRVDPTLAQYFDKANTLWRAKGLSFDPVEWFNDAAFRVNGVKKYITPKEYQVTTFRLTSQKWPNIRLPEKPSIPAVLVFSPVEVRITDLVTGSKYRSTSEIGDGTENLLMREPVDQIAENVDEEQNDEDPVPNEDELSTAYLLKLPSTMYGHPIDVEVVGVGNGEFAVHYDPGDSYLRASDTFEGTISVGERKRKTLAVQEVVALEAELEGDRIALRWTERNRGFRLQFSGALTAGGAWQDVQSETLNEGNGRVTFEPLGASKRFYRLIRTSAAGP